MIDAITILWTIGPFIAVVIAFAYSKQRMGSLVILANLLAGQAFNNQVGAAVYSPWSAVSFGCIDYVTATALFAVCAWRSCAVYIVLVFIHVYYAKQFSIITDEDSLFKVGYHYGWWTFTLAMLATLQLRGGSGGRKRRVGDVPLLSFSGSNHPWIAACRAYSRRVRG